MFNNRPFAGCCNQLPPAPATCQNVCNVVETCNVQDQPHIINYHTHQKNNFIRRHVTVPQFSFSGGTEVFDEFGGPAMPFGGAPSMPFGGGPAMPFAGGPAMPFTGSPVPFAGASMPSGGSPVPFAGASMPFGGAPSMPFTGSPVPFAGASMPSGGSPVPFAGASMPFATGPQPEQQMWGHPHNQHGAHPHHANIHCKCKAEKHSKW